MYHFHELFRVFCTYSKSKIIEFNVSIFVRKILRGQTNLKNLSSAQTNLHTLTPCVSRYYRVFLCSCDAEADPVSEDDDLQCVSPRNRGCVGPFIPHLFAGVSGRSRAQLIGDERRRWHRLEFGDTRSDIVRRNRNTHSYWLEWNERIKRWEHFIRLCIDCTVSRTLLTWLFIV